MQLEAISFRNYKAFQKLECIEVRPLTILIGRNSSGKSVITRLPLLIARALSDRAKSPLDLEFDGMDYGASFPDLIHNRNPHGSVSVGAAFASEAGRIIEFRATVQHYDEYRLQIISRFELKEKDCTPVTLTWVGKDPVTEIAAYRLEETQVQCQAIFRGLFPMEIQSCDKEPTDNEMLQKLASYVRDVRNALSAAMERMTYLGPFREEPKRTYRFPGGLMRDVGFGGAKAPELLGDDYLRRRGKVLDAVADWFSEHLGGWRLGLSKQGEGFSLIMYDLQDPSVEINITDVGTGIAQVLPIVVQRQFDAITGEKGGVEIVEQPELHLHPGAHGDLADLYVEAAKQPAFRFIIETHSENFLLRIRRRVAEGKMDPNKIAIYWISDEPGEERQIQPIRIMVNGEVDTWPAKVFSEDFEEVRAIRNAQEHRR